MKKKITLEGLKKIANADIERGVYACNKNEELKIVTLVGKDMTFDVVVIKYEECAYDKFAIVGIYSSENGTYISESNHLNVQLVKLFNQDKELVGDYYDLVLEALIREKKMMSVSFSDNFGNQSDFDYNTEKFRTRTSLINKFTSNEDGKFSTLTKMCSGLMLGMFILEPFMLLGKETIIANYFLAAIIILFLVILGTDKKARDLAFSQFKN